MTAFVKFDPDAALAKIRADEAAKSAKPAKVHKPQEVNVAKAMLKPKLS